MEARVREILSWYGSDNPGTKANLYRFLTAGRLGGTGKLVMLPVDQGFEHGPARSFAPNPPGYDPRYHFQLALDAALALRATRILVLSGGGGRLDHSLAELLVLTSPRYANVELDATVGRARCHVVRGTRTLVGERGELVSLFAVGGSL